MAGKGGKYTPTGGPRNTEEANLLEDLWHNRRHVLDRAFFNREDVFSSRTAQDDFTEFFDRYVEHLRRQPDRNPVDDRPADPSSDLPEYNKKYRWNFRISTPSLRRNDRGCEKECALFKQVLHLYKDFRQKQHYQKLRQLVQGKRKLPIRDFKNRILDSVNKHGIVLVVGSTGCGKSTQVPQYLLEGGFDKIVCTQPRRIAAISLCRRVAQELLTARNGEVAYQIRFDSTRTRWTKILFVTEGLLIRLLENDLTLPDFNVVIVDEVHERHVTMDVLLGVLSTLRTRRPDLKIVLMSATMHVELFSKFFDLPQDAVVEVPGRIFPVQIDWLPVPDEPEAPKLRHEIDTGSSMVRGNTKKAEFDVRPFLNVLRGIEKNCEWKERGDVLIFVAGAFEVDSLVSAVRELDAKRWISLPLHSQLPSEQQDKVFDVAPAGTRKVIVATNIAETSVTIDGIRFVIDSGMMRSMDSDSASALRQLTNGYVSQAASEQRKGRAGRTGPGRCYRLYSERLFAQFDQFIIPEIQRIAFEETILKVLALGFTVKFPFPDPPLPSKMIGACRALLLTRAVIFPGDSIVNINDMTVERLLDLQLTPLGRALSRLPVSLNVGRLLLLSLVFDQIHHAVVLAAAMSLHNPFCQRPYAKSDYQLEADDRGDLFTSANVYRTWLAERSSKSGGGFNHGNYKSGYGKNASEKARRWCRLHGVDESRLFELNKNCSQLLDQVSQIGAQQKDEDLDSEDEMLERDRRRRQKYANMDEFNRKKDLRRELQQLKDEDGRRERKLLRMDDSHAHSDDDGLDSGSDRGGHAHKKKKVRGANVQDGKMRQRNVEFDLKYMQHRHTSLASHEPSKRDFRLMHLCVGLAMWPNIAIPHALNSNRNANDAVFLTKPVDFASLHPRSSIFKECHLLTAETCIAYGAILQTQKPYLTHVTPVPLVPTCLMAASRLDTNDTCSMLIVDEWLILR